MGERACLPSDLRSYGGKHASTSWPIRTFFILSSDTRTGTIACDIAARFGADMLSGIIYVTAIPHLGPPMFPDAITESNAAR